MADKAKKGQNDMKILFMGDSITDSGRCVGNGSTISIGQSYPMLIDGRLSVDYPGKFEFVNTGISGHRVVDLYARIKRDFWNHTPNVFSCLIGINDVWHEQDGNGVENERFDAVYRMLVGDTLKRFPDMKMILMEPFVLRGEATEKNWDMFARETALRAATVKRIAADFGQVFLPLQDKFDAACKICDAAYWTPDGVHPSPAGHQLIADAWIEAFKKHILR